MSEKAALQEGDATHTLVDQAPVRITANVLQQIRATIGGQPPESGGVLGGNRDEQHVTLFLFDESAATSPARYSPNTEVVNATLDRWDAEGGHKLIGFVHSHPDGCAEPSHGDLRYAHRILTAIPGLARLFLPIAVFEAGPTAEVRVLTLWPFAAWLDADGRGGGHPVPMGIGGGGGAVPGMVGVWPAEGPARARRFESCAPPGKRKSS